MRAALHAAHELAGIVEETTQANRLFESGRSGKVMLHPAE